MKHILNLVLLLSLVNTAFGLEFNLPKPGDSIVGEPKTAQVSKNNKDAYIDIPDEYDVGYYELLEANPGVDPDDPPVGTILIIPTQYILPKELKRDTIVINTAEMRLYYQPKYGNKVYVFPVGIGKEDWETPLCESTIVEKIPNPTWTMPESIYRFLKSAQPNEPIVRVKPPGPENPLGKYKLRLSTTAYLIHGTNVPEGIGRRGTAGCIRLYSKDIEQLYHMVSVGTRVISINRPFKAGWHGKDLYLEAHMALFEQRLEMGENVKPVFDVVAAEAKIKNAMIDWVKTAKIAREHLVIPRKIN